MDRDTTLFQLFRSGMQTAASWAGSAAPRLSQTILVSRNEDQVGFDVAKGWGRPRLSLVLQGGAFDGDDRPQNFFDVLDDGEIWEPRSPVVIGASVAQGLHPVLVDALAGLVLQRGGNRSGFGYSGDGLTDAGPISSAACHLAGWIGDRARDVGAKDTGDLSIQAEELPYFLASSGWRARAAVEDPRRRSAAARVPRYRRYRRRVWPYPMAHRCRTLATRAACRGCRSEHTLLPRRREPVARRPAPRRGRRFPHRAHDGRRISDRPGS